MTKWLIRDDQPFAGNAQSLVKPDGTVAYTDGLTVDQYQQERGFSVRLIDDDEFDALLKTYHDGMVTAPAPITEQRYWDMLGCLPPSRWHTVAGFEVFHVCEGITADLVSWFAKRGQDYFEFVDHAGITDDELTAKLTAQ